MEGGQQAQLQREQARLVERPRRPAPLSRGDAADLPPADELRPPAAPVGTWLSTADRANHDATAVWAGGGSGASQTELERSLRKVVKAQRDAEVRLQLELQKKVELSGTAARMMAERELLSAQVEDIRGRLLEAKLQNVRLKNELNSRSARDSSECQRCCGRCLCCRSNRIKQNVNARSEQNNNKHFDCQQVCCFALIMAVIVGSMMIAFALTMEL